MANLFKWIKNNDSIVFAIHQYSTSYGSGYAAGYIDGKWRSGWSSSMLYGKEIEPPTPNWKRGMMKFMWEWMLEYGEEYDLRDFINNLNKHWNK